MENQTSDLTLLSSAWYTAEDVTQEQALRALLGIDASKGIIRKQFESKDRELAFADLASGAPAESPWQQQAFSPEAIDRLITWAFEQSEEVQLRLLAFLDDPENSLADTIAWLSTQGLLAEEEPKPGPAKVSVTSILNDALPATKEELIQLVQTVSPTTRRPAATVRQFLRRNDLAADANGIINR